MLLYPHIHMNSHAILSTYLHEHLYYLHTCVHALAYIFICTNKCTLILLQVVNLFPGDKDFALILCL